MNHFLKALGWALLLTNILTAAQAAPKDTTDLPAIQSNLAVNSPLFSIARTGKRLVAVGQRGHILVSEDGGQQWQQAKVPVSTDLTAVHFPSPSQGWAVGHDGIILHTSDGGHSWVKQLDGRQAANLIVSYYEKSNQRNHPAVAAIVGEAKRMQTEGPDLPFLNVLFENEQTGYVVGSFNLAFMTNDGGKSWTPISERIDNPKGYHLYGIGAADNDLYVAGELGLLLKLDRATDRFIAVATPYKGTYFGVLAKPGLVMTYGLRGNAYRSNDGGTSWQKVETNVQTGLNAASILDDGRIALVSQGGNVLVSADDGQTFKRVPDIKPVPIFGIASADKDHLALVGLRGARVETLK